MVSYLLAYIEQILVIAIIRFVTELVFNYTQEQIKSVCVPGRLGIGFPRKEI